MRNRLQITIVLLAGMSLTILGAWATLQELSPYIMGPQSGTDSILELRTGALKPGLAISTQRDYLLKCSSALSSYDLLRETEDQQRALTDACQATANAMAAGQGANSLAWLVSAQLAARRSDYAAMNLGLRNSYATAPYEQWLASLRFDLAESYLANLEPDVSASHVADIRLMATSNLARRRLVATYLNNESFKSRAIEIIQTLPDDQQRRFVQSVRQSASHRGAPAGE